jgi:hypothetical protein
LGVIQKRDASFARLSAHRLYDGSSLAFKDIAFKDIVVDEFIFPSSLMTIDAHYTQHNAFPPWWQNLVTFVEKISFYNS